MIYLPNETANKISLGRFTLNSEKSQEINVINVKINKFKIFNAATNFQATTRKVIIEARTGKNYKPFPLTDLLSFKERLNSGLALPLEDILDLIKTIYTYSEYPVFLEALRNMVPDFYWFWSLYHTGGLDFEITRELEGTDFEQTEAFHNGKILSLTKHLDYDWNF